MGKVNQTEKDPLQKRLEIANWIILAILVAGSLVLRSPRFSLGVFCGGLISVVNFHLLYHNLSGFFTKYARPSRAAIMLLYYIRLAATAFALYLLISRDLVDVIGLVIGLSVVVMNIVLTTVVTLSKKNRLEEVG